jgi:hypothetical protein
MPIENRNFGDVSLSAKNVVGSDVACGRGISLIAVETPHVLCPTTFLIGKGKLSNCRNEGSF